MFEVYFVWSQNTACCFILYLDIQMRDYSLNIADNILDTVHFCLWFHLHSCKYNLEDHSFSKYVKFSEKLTFLTLWYAIYLQWQKTIFEDQINPSHVNGLFHYPLKILSWKPQKTCCVLMFSGGYRKKSVAWNVKVVNA